MTRHRDSTPGADRVAMNAAEGADIAAACGDLSDLDHAVAMVRSQTLSALYEAARRGEISAAEGLERARGAGKATADEDARALLEAALSPIVSG